MLVVANEKDALAQLRAGLLCCPRCAGPLAPWGYARHRQLRGPGGAAVELRPPRARCRSCKSAHVVLPGWCLPRRRDTAKLVIGALVAKVSGAGHRKIARSLGLPATTVRGWVRAATLNLPPSTGHRARAMNEGGYVRGKWAQGAYPL